ncbi:NUDIX hydrolase, partial [Microbacterium lacticum]|uniref:NUDIX domain-containing protein n=1 Tax=Microbacterium lacticum TaxID=33885 RepID=UPI003A88E901
MTELSAGLADEPAEVEIIRTERVFHGRVWDVLRDEFAYNGASIVREYVDHTGAVAVLALDDDDRMLLIKQYRHPVRMRDWEIPAGLLDIAGEDPLTAAQRELAEEADLAAAQWDVLGEFTTSPGGSDEAIRIYLARGLTATAEAFDRDEEEADIEVRWASLDEVVDAVLARRVQNPSLIVGALAAHASRARGWSTLAPADSPWPGRPR